MALAPIAAGIGAAANLIGAGAGIFGAQQNAALQRAQLDLGYQQYYLQKRLAELQQEMATAGTTDARGDRTEYVRGLGWISRPTETTRGLLSASDAEERRRLTEDAMRRRMNEQNQFADQLRDRADAEAVRSDRTGAQTLDDVRAAMLRRNAADASMNQSAISNIGVNALRGGTNTTEALQALASNNRNSMRSAIASADAEAPTEYLARRNARIGDLTNRQLAFSGAARTPIGVPAQLSSIDNSLNAFLANRAQTGTYGMQGVGRGIQVPQGQIRDYTPLGIGAFGTAIEKLLGNEKITNWLESAFGNSTKGTGQKYADAYARAQQSGYEMF